MAFTYDRKNKQNKPEVESGLESAAEDGSIEFLQPKKDVVKDSVNDPYAAEIMQKSAYQHTLKTLNALKIVSPIISALMHFPGVDAPKDQLSISFKELISETSNISESVCEQLGIDPTKEKNFWIRNVLERSFSEILNTQWINNKKLDIEVLKPLIEHIVKFGETVSEENKYEDIPEEALIKVAGIKAMIPILSEVTKDSIHSLYRNIDNDIENIMTKLFETSKLALDKLSNEYADSKDKAKLFYILMVEAGTLYSISWKCEVNRIATIMQSYDAVKLQDSINKYKNSGGFPLTKIESDFDKYFDKMLVVTHKLVKNQKRSPKK